MVLLAGNLWFILISYPEQREDDDEQEEVVHGHREFDDVCREVRCTFVHTENSRYQYSECRCDRDVDQYVDHCTLLCEGIRTSILDEEIDEQQ